MTATLSPRTAVTTCVIPGKPHESDAGLLICRNHLDQMGEWLYDIESEAGQLDARPSMAIVWDASGGDLASHRSPARLDPLVQNDRRRGRPLGDDWAGMDDTLSVYATLHAWAATVRVDRDLASSGPFTVGTERRLLTRHLDWAAGQRWISDLWVQLRTLRVQLQASNGTSDPKPIGGRCPRLVDDVECGGRLWPVEPKHTSGGRPDSLIRAIGCEHDAGHYWDGVHLARLFKILEDQKAGKA